MTGALEDFSLFVRRWLPAAIWMLVIIVISTDWGSGTHSFTLLKPILVWWNPQISLSAIYEAHIFFRKSMHVIQFAILGVLIWKTRRPLWHTPEKGDWRLIGFALLTAAVFSILSECVQLLYPQSRGASVKDVGLNISGTAAMLLLIHLIGGHKKRSTPSPSRKSSRILITADVYLDNVANAQFSALAQISKAVTEFKPDILVIAGDLATADEAKASLLRLRKEIPDLPIVVCLGNYDHWIDSQQWEHFPSTASIREKIWRPAMTEADIHGLDFSNLELEDIVLTGGYGHFDLSMRDTHLSSQGREATLEDYKNGYFVGLHWKDMNQIPAASESLLEEATSQAEGISKRLSEASGSGKSVLFVSHTVPFRELNGHNHPPTSLKRFFNAYAGNSLIGAFLEESAANICLAVCGHTHTHVPLQRLRGVPCLNIGSDREHLRFVLYETGSGKISDIGPVQP